MNCILLSKSIDLADNLADNVTEKSDFRTITNAHQVAHVNKVLKSEVGDSLTIGEVGGNIGQATISHIDDNEVRLIDVVLDKKPPDKHDLTVVLALPRPKVLRRLIMDMTSLGVKKIILVNSYRTQKSYWQSPLLKRLDEFVFEGLQQSIDTVPPIIELKKRFKPFVEDEFVALITANASIQDIATQNTHITVKAVKAIVAHPYAHQSWQDLFLQIKSNHKLSNQNMPSVVCIGAEGGWIDYEVDVLAKHGCIAVSLGSRILRTESAVNVMLASWLV